MTIKDFKEIAKEFNLNCVFKGNYYLYSPDSPKEIAVYYPTFSTVTIFHSGLPPIFGKNALRQGLYQKFKEEKIKQLKLKQKELEKDFENEP